VAKVVLTSGVSQQFTGGRSEIEVRAATVRQLLRELDDLYPGLGDELGTDTAIAIDGEIFQDPYLEAIGADSEIYFLPRIGGG
jgi:molybdopterin converting factor small subunit